MSVPGHRFETVNLSDHAVAHLGDRHDHTYQIQQATFLPADAGLPSTSNVIADWLSNSDHEKHQNDTFASVQKNSGKWFLSSLNYKEWRQKAGKVLLLHGIPGAGKTSLASLIVNELRDDFANNSEVMVLFFYNSFSRQREQSAAKIMSSLLRQAYLHDTFTARGTPAKELYESHHKKGRSSIPDLDELTKTLARILKGYERVYLVIDALDECLDFDEVDRYLERHALMSALTRLRSSEGVSLSAIFTTRPPRQNVVASKDVQPVVVQASPRDISSYIDLRLSQTPKSLFQDPKLQQDIKNAIVQQADGMFLLARLQMDLILGFTNRNAVLKFLEDMLHTANMLDSAYVNTLERIKDSKQSDLAGRALACVVFAKQPLSARELQYAIALNSNSSSLSEDDLDEMTSILEICAGLLVVDEQSDVVRLVHNTAADFLINTRDKWLGSYRHHLTQACLFQLLMRHKHTPISARNSRSILHDHCAFTAYAIMFWWQHVVDDDSRSSWSCIPETLNLTSIIRDTLRVSLEKTPTDPLHGLEIFLGDACRWQHLLAWLGLIDVFEYMVKATKEDSPYLDSLVKAVICRDGHGLTPIAYAACAGHFEFVSLMLSWSTDIQQKWNNDTQTWLLCAVRSGQDLMANMIIDLMHGMPIPNNGIYVETLVEAIKKDLASTFRRLVEHPTARPPANPHYVSADMTKVFNQVGLQGSQECLNALRDFCRTQPYLSNFIPQLLGFLAESTLKSPERMVMVNEMSRLYPEHVNSEAGIPGVGWRTMLHCACEELNLPLVQILSTVPGIDFNVKNRNGYTPLMLACMRRGLGKVMLEVLCQFSDVNYRNPNTGWTALHEAANTVEYWGRDGAGGGNWDSVTGLQKATSYTMMSKVLRAAGADPHIRDDYGRTAADIATLRSGERQISMRLIELEAFATNTPPLSEASHMETEETGESPSFTSLKNVAALVSDRAVPLESRVVDLDAVIASAENLEKVEKKVKPMGMDLDAWVELQLPTR